MKKIIIYGVIAFVTGLVFIQLTKSIVVKNNTVENIPIILTDTLPLENAGEVNIKLLEGNKEVCMAIEDFEYIVKKRRTGKKVLKSLNSLFARLEG